MANHKFCILRRTDEGTLTYHEHVVVQSEDGAYSYALAELPEGIVIKDTTDGTTAWRIEVSKTGVISTTQVTAA